MKHNGVVLGCIILSCTMLYGEQASTLMQPTFIDFDSAMNIAHYPEALAITKRAIGLDGNLLKGFFKDLYDKNKDIPMIVASEPRIPKIIHQIWLGSPLPDAFKKYIDSWHRMHPGWFYKLWTDEDVRKIQLVNQELYDQATNFGQKSDILRYEILYRFGGVYVDMDFECLRSLEPLHYMYDFYTALQPLDTQYIQLGNALIGCKPKHEIIKQCIIGLITSADYHGIPAKTGPIHFTRIFYQYAGKGESIDIAFPSLYFYPFGCMDKVIDKTSWIKNGAFAVHWWAKSWMPKQYRPQQFKAIDNANQVKTWND